MGQIMEEDKNSTWFDLIKFAGGASFVIAVIYFFGSCVFMPSYKTQAMSGNYIVFDQAIVGKGPQGAVLNKGLLELAQITNQGIEKSDLSQTISRLDALQANCKKQCESIPSLSPPLHYPGNYYYPQYKNTCTYGPSCTEAEYKTYEHLRDMLDAGVLSKDKMNHYLSNYPNYGSWFMRTVWVGVGGFVSVLVLLLGMVLFFWIDQLVKNKQYVKAQKIHDKVRVMITYKTPGFAEEVSSKDLRKELEMNLIDEQDQREAVRAVRFLERNGR